MYLVCGGPIIPNNFSLRISPNISLTSTFTQLIQALRMKVIQGAMTQQQAREHLAMIQASTPHLFPGQGVPQLPPPGFPAGGMLSGTPVQQLATLPQLERPQSAINDQISPFSQAQDPSHARQFSMLPAQYQQQQQNDSGLTCRVGQCLNPLGMGLQSPLTPSASQPPPPNGQQVPIPCANFADLPLHQLRMIYAQIMRSVIEGEKNFQASSTSGGEGDIQRQQFRAKLDAYKQRLLQLQEIINAKARAT
jgi:hypothetical protein